MTNDDKRRRRRRRRRLSSADLCLSARFERARKRAKHRHLRAMLHAADAIRAHSNVYKQASDRKRRIATRTRRRERARASAAASSRAFRSRRVNDKKRNDFFCADESAASKRDVRVHATSKQKRSRENVEAAMRVAFSRSRKCAARFVDRLKRRKSAA